MVFISPFRSGALEKLAELDQQSLQDMINYTLHYQSPQRKAISDYDALVLQLLNRVGLSREDSTDDQQNS